MAFSILGGLGTGLAQGGGSHARLMLAERLKREAEERAMAQRRQLAEEAFGRQEQLLGRREDREDARWNDEQELAARLRAEAKSGELARTLGVAESMNLPGTGAAERLTDPSVIANMPPIEVERIIGQLQAGVAESQKMAEGRITRDEALAGKEPVTRGNETYWEVPGEPEPDEERWKPQLIQNEKDGKYYWVNYGDQTVVEATGIEGLPEGDKGPEFSAGQAEAYSADFADQAVRQTVVDSLAASLKSPNDDDYMALQSRVGQMFSTPEVLYAQYPELKDYRDRVEQFAQRYYMSGEFSSKEEMLRAMSEDEELGKFSLVGLSAGEDSGFGAWMDKHLR